MILDQYEELVGKLYCESIEGKVTGLFLALTTDPVPKPSKVSPRKTKINKKMKEPASYHDVRNMIKAGRQEKAINTDKKAVAEIN